MASVFFLYLQARRPGTPQSVAMASETFAVRRFLGQSPPRPENDERVGTPYENSRRSGVDTAGSRARADELAQHMEDAAEDAEAR